MIRVTLLLPMLLILTPARAEVVRLEITGREAPALGGRSFATGVAEKLTGRATLAVDPGLPGNDGIVDLAQAPRNAQGRVEAVTDVVILRPAKPNGTLLFEVVNRGRKLLPGWSQDTDGAASSRLGQATDAGTGFLLDQGFTLVWAGWQADVVAPGVGIAVPTVAGVTGLSREEAQFDGTPGPKRLVLSYPAADPALPRLSMRASPDAPATQPAGLTFRFLDPSTVEITPPEGASATALYDFAYVARDPRVMGMGLVAIRDVVAFLHHDASEANPLRGTVQRTIALGISQSGRVLRDLLYAGLNQDEAGRQVFDGMMPIVPGARRSFTNARFAQPGRNPGPQFDRLFPVLQFPFTYPTTTDALSGREDGLLVRCTATQTCPKVIQADSEFEFWGSQASLVATTPQGVPVAMPANVRLFMFTGTPHSNVWDAVASRRADCALPLNPNSNGPALRSLIVAMQGWIADGTEPPESRYPSRTLGTLTTAEHAYPDAPALQYRRQHARAEYVVQTPEGPEVRGEYPLFLPLAGPDGNAVAGIRLPIVAAPRASYTGWNPVDATRQPGGGPQDLCTQMGGVVPLPAQADPDDPRPALATLYPTPDAYVAAVRAAAAELVAARLLQPGDAAGMEQAARAGTLDKLGPLTPRP